VELDRDPSGVGGVVIIGAQKAISKSIISAVINAPELSCFPTRNWQRPHPRRK